MANMIGILHSGWAENVHFPTVLGRCCCYLCIIRLYEKDHKLFVRKLLLVHRPSFFLSLSFSVKLALHSVWIHLKIKRC